VLGIFGSCCLKPERLYHAPSLLSFAFLFFIIPQAVAVENLGINKTLIDNGAYEITLFYSILCILASLVGWHGKIYRKLFIKLEKSRYLINPKKFFYMISLLALFANLAGLRLSNLSDSGSIESIGGQTTGIGSILIFVARFIYIPYPYFIGRLVSKTNIPNFLYLFLSSFSEFKFVILHGRRSPLASLSFPFLMLVFFKKRWLLPRIVVPFIIIIPLILIPALAILRFEFWALLFSGQMDFSSLAVFIRAYFLENYPYDLMNSVNAIALSLKQGYVGFGSGFWNDIVFNFVPAQLLGRSFKESLYINISPLSYLRTRQLSIYFDVKFGTTLTGLGSTFAEFSFFGFLCFYFQAKLMRTVWESALRNVNIAQILYAFLTTSLFISVTHNFSRFINTLIIGTFLLLFLVRFSRISRRKTFSP
jgi:hypothetical protein